MDRIRKVSLFCQAIFLISLISLPIGIILNWMFINELHHLYGHGYYLSIPKYIHFTYWPITASSKISGLTGSLIYTIGPMTILYFLIKLFGLYARGHIFARENVRYIRLIGFAFIWQFVLVIYASSILSSAMHQNDPTITTLTIIDTSQIFIGLIVILISWVMEEGRKLKEEQDLTV